MSDEGSVKVPITEPAAEAKPAGRPETRITLTYPAINASRHIVFLVSGETKRAILQEVLAGGSTKPAARLSPMGEILFIADRAAAGM
jgi:6-phosphogluconolactonase